MPQPFNNAVMTNAGARLLTRAQAGEIKIEFTKIEVGNGNYTADEKTLDALQKRTALKSVKNSYAISDIDTFSDYSVKVTALITNQDPITGQTLVNDGYYINEMGLFAKAKDGADSTEILYSITTTTGDNGDFMPPYNGYNPAQIIQEYYATVSNSAEVAVQGNTGAVALAEDLQEANIIISELKKNKVDKEDGKGLSANDYTDEEKEQVAQIENVSAQANAAYNRANTAYTQANAAYNAANNVAVKLNDSTVVIGANAKAVGNVSTALGYYANASGNDCTAVGSYANARGNCSTALGRSARADGNNCIAIGYRTIAYASDSAAIGLNAITENQYCTALGYCATAKGIRSTALGSYANAGGNNCTAVGYYAMVANTKSNTMQLGNASSLSELSCRVALTVTSDERDKADITEIGNGAVEFLKKIKAIRYVFNHRELYIDEENLSEEEKKKKEMYGLCEYDREAHAKGTKKGTRVRVGVSAQETQKALEETYGSSSYANLVNDNLYDINPDGIPEGVESQLSANYEGFIPFLIKAVQELAARLEALEEPMKGA